jgi:hypothetical protein
MRPLLLSSGPPQQYAARIISFNFIRRAKGIVPAAQTPLGSRTSHAVQIVSGKAIGATHRTLGTTEQPKLMEGGLFSGACTLPVRPRACLFAALFGHSNTTGTPLVALATALTVPFHPTTTFDGYRHCIDLAD